MFKSLKSIVVIALVGAVVIAGALLVSGWTKAAPAASAAPAAPAAETSSALNVDVGKYANLAVKSFEGQLGIDDTQLNAAFTGAVGDTLDQAVKDGLLTADQAAQVNAFVKDGVTGLIAKLQAFMPRFGTAQKSGGMTARMPMAHPLPGLKNAASLDRAKYANLFITAFESRLNIDDARLNAALNAAVTATTAQAVTDGWLTSDQATQLDNFATMGVRQLAALTNRFPFGGARGPLAGMWQPATLASALGMSSADLEAQLKAGKSIANIAAAQHLDLAQVKQTILSQFKTQLDTAVKNGKLTQTLADVVLAKFSSSLDALINKSISAPK